MITINIETRKQNRLRDFFLRPFDKLEDILFSMIQRLPEKATPSPLLNWLDRYTTRRINKLRQQIIQQNWRNIQLQKALESLYNPDAKEAPSDD